MIALVSACLLGINCRYDGGNSLDKRLIDAIKEKNIIPIPVCPEQISGLSTPRKQCEIVEGDGFDVLNGRARVISIDGEDLTEFFIRGAMEVLKIVKILNIKIAIMKQYSPSCACGVIYDGTFKNRFKSGYGVTSALLIKNGVRVISHQSLNNIIKS